MRLLFTVYLLSLFFFSYGQIRYAENKIILKDSIYWLKYDMIPATGIVFGETTAGDYTYKFEYGLKNGLLDGEYKWKYNDGKLSQLEFYKKGIRVGPMKRWWMNGNLQLEMNTDFYKSWYKSGQLKVYTDYKNRQPKKCWDEDGKESQCN